MASHATDRLSEAERRRDAGDLLGALIAIGHLIELAPGDHTPYFVRALIHEELGDVRGAVADYSTFIDEHPLGPTARRTLASAYLVRGTLRLYTLGDAEGLADLHQAVALRDASATEHRAA